MKRSSKGPLLTAVLVDYDNIYLSLKRKSEEAAKRFAKDAGLWLREIESGRLITATNSAPVNLPRRLVLNRCYGNPVPRRNTSDNSTDMSSFPFVRHHFLRAGFEVVDCPPLTAQLKNSSDIRMVMDVRDFIGHDTYFDEFVILSGDADFTPVLHRLRAHARHTVVYANDHTAAPYTAVSDGEVRESDLIALLAEGRLPGEAEPNNAPAIAASQAAQLEAARREIVAEVVGAVRASAQPIPLEVLADRAVRTLGHDKTAGSAWGGAGSFRELLASSLPAPVRLSEQPPYFVIDASRHLAPAPAPQPAPRIELQGERVDRPSLSTPQGPSTAPAVQQHQAPLQVAPERIQVSTAPLHPVIAPPAAAAPPLPQQHLAPPMQAPAQQQPVPRPAQPAAQAMAQPHPVAHPAPMAQAPQYVPVPQRSVPQAPSLAPQPQAAPELRHSGPAQPAYRPAAPVPQQPQRRAGEAATALQQSIARIHDACQAPPLSPPEYRVLFEAMAREINEQGLTGAQTLDNILARAQESGTKLRRDDVRFVLDVVSEPDPWFEQGASPNLFAGRFRNFVVARCRSQGLNLSVDELDLIEAWFVGGGAAGPSSRVQAPSQPAPQPAYGRPGPETGPDRWAVTESQGQTAPVLQTQAATAPLPPAAPAPQYTMAGPEHEAEDFPRIVRTRMRG